MRARVPLVIKLPLSVATVSERQISTVVPTPSIMPTILDLCKIDYKKDALSVRSLSPLWGPTPSSFREQAVISTGLAHDYENRESVTFEGWKYIRFFLKGREELYDLSSDPEERVSLVLSSPETVAHAKQILEEHNRIVYEVRDLHRISAEKNKLAQETLERLKALGYVR